MNKNEERERYESGKRAAENDAKNTRKTLKDKPFGQTTKEVYPYTYWWVKGYNDGLKELKKSK